MGFLLTLFGTAGNEFVKHLVSKKFTPSPAATAAKAEQSKLFVRDVRNLMDKLNDARWAKVSLQKKAKEGRFQQRPIDLTQQVHTVCETRREMKRAATQALALTSYKGLLRSIERDFDGLLKDPRSSEASVHAAYDEIVIAMHSIQITVIC